MENTKGVKIKGQRLTQTMVLGTGMLLSILFISLGITLPPCQAKEPSEIIIIETMTAPIVQEFTESFLMALKSPPPADSSLKIKRFNAHGNMEEAKVYLRQQVSAETDLVVAVATVAASAASSELTDKNIPLLFMCVIDPVGAGLIEEVGVPTNSFITGKVHYIPVETKIELVMQVARRIKPEGPITFGYIHTDYPADLGDLQRLAQEANNRSDFNLVTRKISYQPVDQYKKQLLQKAEQAVTEIVEEIDFWWAPLGVLAVLPEFNNLLLSYSKIPFLVGATEGSVEQGALLHLTGDPQSQGQDLAKIAQLVLEGKDVGSIAPTLPNKLQFAVNRKTAEQLGIAIPSEIMELAKDRVYPR